MFTTLKTEPLFRLCLWRRNGSLPAGPPYRLVNVSSSMSADSMLLHLQAKGNTKPIAVDLQSAAGHFYVDDLLNKRKLLLGDHLPRVTTAIERDAPRLPWRRRAVLEAWLTPDESPKRLTEKSRQWLTVVRRTLQLNAILASLDPGSSITEFFHRLHHGLRHDRRHWTSLPEAAPGDASAWTSLDLLPQPLPASFFRDLQQVMVEARMASSSQNSRIVLRPYVEIALERYFLRLLSETPLLKEMLGNVRAAAFRVTARLRAAGIHAVGGDGAGANFRLRHTSTTTTFAARLPFVFRRGTTTADASHYVVDVTLRTLRTPSLPVSGSSKILKFLKAPLGDVQWALNCWSDIGDSFASSPPFRGNADALQRRQGPPNQ